MTRFGIYVTEQKNLISFLTFDQNSISLKNVGLLKIILKEKVVQDKDFLTKFVYFLFKMTLVQPCGDMSVKIRESLREPDADAIDRDVAAIKKWLTTQPHLPRDMDDARLRTFLRGCKFSLEKVKKKLDMYYTMRNMCPEFFTNRDVSSPELKFILDRV